MTDIRELLHEATDGLDIDDRDPVGRVRRATARRRRNTGAVLVVIVAVLAAIVVPLSLQSSTTHHLGSHPSPTATPTLDHWAPADSRAASGFGSVWGLHVHYGSSKFRPPLIGPEWIDRLDPTTGKQIARIEIKAPASQIATGDGYVWTFGTKKFGDISGSGPSRIMAMNPRPPYQASALTIPYGFDIPAGIAFADGSAWVSFPSKFQVWRLTPPSSIGSSNVFTKSVINLPHQADDPGSEIEVTDSGQIWAQTSFEGAITQIIPTSTGGRVGPTVNWLGAVFGPAGGDTLWAWGSNDGQGQSGLTRFDPSEAAHCQCAGVGHVVPFEAEVRGVQPVTGGAVVTTSHRAFFYDNQALTGTGHPTDKLGPQNLETITGDGPGVVLGLAHRGLLHWIPGSMPSRGLVQHWAPQDGDVVAYGGYLWALKCCSVQQGTSWVDQLDPATGQRLARISIPSPAFRIFAGAGWIWVTGFNPGGGGPNAITAINPRDRTTFSKNLGTYGYPSDVAFADGSAWVTQPEKNRVLRITPPPDPDPGIPPPHESLVGVPTQVKGSPQTIATTDDGSIWVQRTDAHPGREVKTSGRLVLDTGQFSLLGPWGRTGLIQTGAGHRVIDGSPIPFTSCASGHHCPHNASYAVTGHVFAAVQSLRGLFVTTAKNTYLFGGGQQEPIAVLGVGGTSLALDGNGVVIGSDGGLVHWVPAG